ncbi:MAG: UV DNA damage repair endonuclease UvsE [Desulfobulbaceae bacterium]|nr:UV DNA damage repair endonuclease UvsE [Desulfobulbaceae bacterium]
MTNTGKLRFGLCCIFRQEPLKFRQVTAKTLQALPRKIQLERLSEVCLHNVRTLQKALDFVAENNIGAFRILSPLFPRYSHPEVGYIIEDLPDKSEIVQRFAEIRLFRQAHDIRLSFHPDQFNVLSSPRPEVVRNTMRELEYQGMLGEMVDADIINLHAGGTYGNKKDALKRLQKRVDILPQQIRSRLSLENDDKSYTPHDLLPVCQKLKIPLVYDVHHHRCLPDGLTEEAVTKKVIALWHSLGREPYFHISSPKNGWQGGSHAPHADYIDPADFPACWRNLTATVDVEAKAKELAVLRLKKDLAGC